MSRCIHNQVKIRTRYEGSPLFMWKTEVICTEENRVLRRIFSNKRPALEGFS